MLKIIKNPLFCYIFSISQYTPSKQTKQISKVLNISSMMFFECDLNYNFVGLGSSFLHRFCFKIDSQNGQKWALDAVAFENDFWNDFEAILEPNEGATCPSIWTGSADRFLKLWKCRRRRMKFYEKGKESDRDEQVSITSKN